MPSVCRRLLAIAGVAASSCGYSLLAQPAPTLAPSLGSAASFAVLGGTAVTNTGTTVVTGNLGVSPGSSISGFPPGVVKVGSIRNDLAQQAQKDAAAAYGDIASRQCGPVTSQTLAPGVYCLSSLTGILTLDAAGDANAVWIFRSATLTTDPDSSVRVINGGYAGDVFWQADDTVTLGARTAFVGNILARNSITLHQGASLSGRALALTGAVTLDTNNVSLCCQRITVAPATLPNGKAGTPFAPVTFTASGGAAPYTFSFTGSIPPGLTHSGATLSGTPTQGNSYTFTVTATDSLGCWGSQTYTIDVACGTIVIDPPELPKTCEVSQVVTASGGVGPYVFSVTPLPLPAGITLVQTSETTALLSGGLTTPGCTTVTVTATDKFSCSTSRSYTICELAISPETLPNGIVGTPYPTTTITATFGTPPYTCTVSAGTVPPGLTFAGCTIMGTPTTPGCFTFTVTVADALGYSCSITYTVCVAVCALTISPETFPGGIEGTPYPPTTITASGGTAPYTCSYSGTLPPGLSFAGCTISGTPTTTGCFTFTGTVTDAAGCISSKSYTICIACANVIVSPSTLPGGIAGMPYPTTPITASGGTAPYSCSVTGNVPPGLSFAGCTISGTPATRGCFTFNVTTTDAAGCSGSRTYKVCVACPDIIVSPASLPNGNVGTPYGQAITASGGTAPYTFSVVSGSLPPGLTLNPGGALSGTPTTTGPYCFSVMAVDDAGCPGGPVNYSVTVSAASCPPGTIITLAPPSLPGAATGAPYAQMITASGGTAPYTFAVTAGALPSGLMLTPSGPSSALVSGTPTASGIYYFTLTATDANGCVGSMGCSIPMLVDIPAVTGWGMGVLSLLLLVAGLAMIPKGGAA